MRIAVALVLGTVVLVAACGGGSGTKVTVPLDATFTPAAASPSSGTTPSATPTVSAAAALDAAFAAGLIIFNAVPNDICKTNNPQQKACLVKDLNPSSPDRGTAAFELGDPVAGGGALVVLGRDATGKWGFWYGTQQEIVRSFNLPADMLVCGFGAGAAVRQSASTTAAALATLPDLARVRAEEFVLTEPGTFSKSIGNGWYRISSPQAGWVRSTAVADAKNGDCKVHDEIEKSVG
jgi:hypothetical protein